MSLVEFYHEQVRFVQTEFQALRAKYAHEMERSVDERVKCGKCIKDATHASVFFSGDPQKQKTYRFKCAANYSDFRQGDRVRLHQGEPLLSYAEFTWLGDGYSDAIGEYFDLCLESQNGNIAILEGESYTVDQTIVDLEKLYLSALEEASSREHGRERILSLFLDDETKESEDDVDPDVYGSAWDRAESDGFNDSQQEAIANAVASSWYQLIQGPPGTGKTRVLANIVKQRVEQGERVLVTAMTHRAIHEALNRIQKTMPESQSIAKIGQFLNDPDLRVPEFEHFNDTPFCSSAEGYVIGATPFGARGKRMGQTMFDCVIIDEASQMPLSLAIMAMLRAESYIFIGDPQQLPPVLNSVDSLQAPQHSVFGRLKHRREADVLEITYRMNQAICEWVGQSFYLGKLTSAPGASEKQLKCAPNECQPWLANALDSAQSLVWISTKGVNTRQFSVEEAIIVLQLLVESQKRGIPLSEIGIVTPFRRQARLIKARLRDSPEIENDVLNQVVIDTVERMQGQEREMVIISTATSDPDFIHAIENFLYQPQRLNVSVSRARTKVITICSDNFLRDDYTTEDISEAIGQWKSLKRASLNISI